MSEKIKKKETATPMVRQYHAIKKQHHDAILFFRLGDFYEMFFEDAVTASRELDLTLTSRHKNQKDRIPMCGIPYHASENYIARLIKKGYKVAICEQVEDPKLAKKLVKRDVVQVITPGTVTDFSMLSQKSHNYLMSLTFDNTKIALGFIDVSTGDFYVTEYSKDFQFAENEITRFKPKEVLVPESIFEDKALRKLFSLYPDILINKYYDWVFDTEYSRNRLLEHFKIHSLKGYGIENKPLVIQVAGGILHYLEQTQKQTFPHIENIRYYSHSEFMVLDNATIRNLELINNLQDNTSSRTLFSVLDHTSTPQGGRLLKQRILEPLLDLERVKVRQDHIDALFKNDNIRRDLVNVLKKVADIERLCSRLALNRATPKDIVALKNSLIYSVQIKGLLSEVDTLTHLGQSIPDTGCIIKLIDECLEEDPPVLVSDGSVIKAGHDKHLDKYRKAQREGKDWIAGLQKDERDKTGINSLKIRYNKVFGYYLEVTKPNLHLVPKDYIRKQTLVNAERFTFARLQEYEEMILSATEKITQIETDLFNALRSKLKENLRPIIDTGKKIARIDYYTSLAECARINNYCRPGMNDSDLIHIRAGRHPVVEMTMGHEPFIPNDIMIDNSENRILIITGPNMAGKSTYLRQLALITLMAHMGSFVPAQEATIGLVDRIFTRVGASDNLARGESTFLVEMNETANILNNATDKSLIIMDEIGRGTSTYDGLSIAWAVIEYIYNKNNIGAKTLFATHYHELTGLGEKQGIRNYNILVREWGDKVIFLRKVEQGSADKSYGIQVAQLAGLPVSVIQRAKQILYELESDKTKDLIVSQSPIAGENGKDQMDLFTVSMISPVEAEILQKLKTIDLDKITPLESLNILSDILKKLVPYIKKE
ncbi:MAG: DNA mismatch repair protein MutS [Spirochaetes bacterium]|nr:DNA mismatch repair protein MutS [Spirochaetota bacterium]